MLYRSQPFSQSTGVAMRHFGNPIKNISKKTLADLTPVENDTEEYYYMPKPNRAQRRAAERNNR